MKSIELERTFLLRYVPGLAGAKSIEISDLYIPKTAAHPVIRIRKIGEDGCGGGRQVWMEMTKKQPVSGNDSSEQSEHTITLSKEEYDALVRLPGKELVKTRYFLGNAQIDVFRGRLEGLVTADFEFSNRQAMNDFRPPVFCLADVTQDRAFAGGMLCGKSYRELEPALARYGHKKISFAPR